MPRGRTFLLTPQNFSASSITASTITDSGLTATHVVYAGTGGLLSGDTGMTWTAATNVLQIGTTTAADGGEVRLPNAGGTGEYLETAWTTNEARIGTSSTGTARTMKIGTGGSAQLQLYTTNTVKWLISTTAGGSGLLPNADASYPIGSSSARVTDVWTRRSMTAQGADVTSANTLTLGGDGDYYSILGTTQINLITTTGYAVGNKIRLKFNGNITVAHAQTASGLTATIMMGSSGSYLAANNYVATFILTSTATVPVWVFAGGNRG